MAQQEITQYDRKVLDVVIKIMSNGTPTFARSAITEVLYSPADNMAVRFLVYALNALSKRGHDVDVANVFKYLRDNTNGMMQLCKDVLLTTKSINNQ